MKRLATFCLIIPIVLTGLIPSAIVPLAGQDPATSEYTPSEILTDSAGLRPDHVTGDSRVTLVGPGGGGWIPTVTIAPDATGTVYAGCDVGGVYKSIDDGQNWTIVNNGLLSYETRVIVVDYQHPATVYVATTGGVFKSTDAAEHWERKRNGFPALQKWSISAPVNALAIDPVDPNVLYAGIGISRKAEGLGPQASSHGAGTIYKTVDGADEWDIVNTGNATINPTAIINGITIDPSDTATLYAATDRGLYKSLDGGVNWTLLNNGLPPTSGDNVTSNVRAVVVDPQSPDTLYATVRAIPNTAPEGVWQGGVYKSIDSGATWESKSVGLANYAGSSNASLAIPENTTSNYWCLVMDPLDPRTLYVGDFSYGTYGLYKTTDGADSWDVVTYETGPDQNMELGWSWANLGITALAIDPQDPDRLYYGGGMCVFKTNDGGLSWQQVYTKQTEAGTWESNGFETHGMYDIEIDPANPDNVYVGYTDIDFQKSTDGGNSFKRCQTMTWHGGNVFDVTIDPDHPNILYAGVGWWEHNSGWLVRSEDYGETWTITGNTANGLPDARVRAVVIDPSSPVDNRTIYVTSENYGVYKSVNGGLTWDPENNGLGTNLYTYKMVMDPFDPATLYVGIRAPIEDSTVLGGVYKTTDGALTWTKVNVDLELPDVEDLAIDPANPDILFVATGQHYVQPSGPLDPGGVFRSTDGGAHWDLVLTRDPLMHIFNVEVVAISPVNPDLVFAGVADYAYHDECPGDGLFMSENGGDTWQDINEGLPMLIINALTAHPTNPDIIYAGTKADGMVRITLPAAPTVTNLSITPATVEPGVAVTVSVLVTNIADVDRTCQVTLMVDGTTHEIREVTVAVGESMTTTFTTTSNEIGTHYIDVNGLAGEFVVELPPSPATFTMSNLTIAPAEVGVGETVDASVLVANIGDLAGSTDIIFEIDGSASATEAVTLAGGENRTVTFTATADLPGEHEVTVGSLSGTFTVLPPPETNPGESNSTDGSGSLPAWLIILIIILIALGLITLMLVRWRLLKRRAP